MLPNTGQKPAAALNEEAPDDTLRHEASELSRQFRLDEDGYLPERRAVVVLSLVAIGAMGLISLYQMGVIKHLPAPRLKGFDSDKIDASPEAYRRFSTPDAVLGVGSYAATLGLAAMGDKDRQKNRPFVPLALLAKVLFDLGQVIRMVRAQWSKQGAFCFWCLLSGGATVASVPLVFGEARAALNRLVERGKGG